MPNALDGKVVIITGAGRGIGKEFALRCAAEGAKVVVNDPGVAQDGGGADATPAEQVVAEIKAAGGEAIANLESVADPAGAARMVEMAVDTFGGLHGLVNNAGILRDAIFHRMTPDAFEAVIRVHLLGSFNLANAAARVFREQGGGSMVHITSTSGLIGSVGQANYSAAKLGIVGLSKSIAMDMQRFNVRSNCVSPFALSRMTAGIPMDTPENIAIVERMRQMGPEKIAPFVAFLLSDAASDVNGQIFGVRKNEIFLFSQNRPIRSVQRNEGWTVEAIAEHAIPAMRSSFYDLDHSDDVIGWDPI